MFTHWLITFYAVQLMCLSFKLQATKISFSVWTFSSSKSC